MYDAPIHLCWNIKNWLQNANHLCCPPVWCIIGTPIVCLDRRVAKIAHWQYYAQNSPLKLNRFLTVGKFPHSRDTMKITYPTTSELAIVAEFSHYWDPMGITYPKTEECAIVAKFPHYLRFAGIHSAHHSFSFGFMAALQHVYSTLFQFVGKFPHYWYFPQIKPLQFNILAILAKFCHYLHPSNATHLQ